jgi:Terminase large subunit, T4likevirus-type, N-terminal
VPSRNRKSTPRQNPPGGTKHLPATPPIPEPKDAVEETPWDLSRAQIRALHLANVTIPDGPLTGGDANRIRAMLRELEKRQCEALKLYEPMPRQHEFHYSRSRQRICRGSNRSGKSTCSMTELAWALTGSHPQRDKYPLEGGRAIVVARDMEKIGEVVWRKLGRAGSFQMVKDRVSGVWRARRESDRERGKAAPPLIPPRLIKDISWEKKAAGQPKKLTLHNGWECNFYSSKADPEAIAGVDVDIVVFDEEVVNEGWFSEAMARLIDRNGWFWWAATPHVGTQQLFDLHQRATALAEEYEGAEEDHVPLVSEVFLSIWDNVHMDEAAKRDFESSLTEDERRLRIDGDFAISGTRVFEANFFPRGVHGVEAFPIPHTWTRFCAIDPGFRVGAVLFAAVPPLKYDGTSDIDPNLYGDFIYLYDEIYIRGCDAPQLAKALKRHIGDLEIFAMLFDSHGGNLRSVGTGILPEVEYRNALKAEKIRMPTCGTMLTYGCDDPNARILRIKDWLRTRPDGTSKLRFIRSAVPQAIRNIERYSWKVTQGEISDKPLGHDAHQADNLGYLCMYNRLRYQKSKATVKRAEQGSYATYKSILAEEQRMKRREAGKELKGVSLA